MSLSHLQVANLRNIESASLNLHPHLNLIEGVNGSGKTSLLEAVYLLGSGHSFRTREISPLVNIRADCLTVFARTDNSQTVSLQKCVSTPTQVRINGIPCGSSSELARFLPCQIFYQDIFQVIDAGPAIRRNVLDWGMFHVKPHYHLLWKDYRRALKQRNSLLRQRALPQYFDPWDTILSEKATALDALRKEYVFLLAKEFNALLSQLTNVECNLVYYKGWDKRDNEKSLQTILAESYSTDLQRQYTQYGAHQADLKIEANQLKAKNYLSRGQQKLILFALKFAQAKLLDKNCIFLCDDIAAELDEIHLSRLLTLMSGMPGQFIITSLENPLIRKLLSEKLHRFKLVAGKIIPF